MRASPWLIKRCSYNLKLSYKCGSSFFLTCFCEEVDRQWKIWYSIQPFNESVKLWLIWKLSFAWFMWSWKTLKNHGFWRICRPGEVTEIGKKVENHGKWKYTIKILYSGLFHAQHARCIHVIGTRRYQFSYVLSWKSNGIFSYKRKAWTLVLLS